MKAEPDHEVCAKEAHVLQRKVERLERELAAMHEKYKARMELHDVYVDIIHEKFPDKATGEAFARRWSLLERAEAAETALAEGRAKWASDLVAWQDQQREMAALRKRIDDAGKVHNEGCDEALRFAQDRADAAKRERDEAKAALAAAEKRISNHDERANAYKDLVSNAGGFGEIGLLVHKLAEARADINCPDCLHMNPDTACTRTEGRA